MKTFLKSVACVLVLLIALVVLSIISTEIAYFVALALTLLAVVALIKPMPTLWLGNRLFSVSVLLFAALPALVGSQDQLSRAEETRLATLKAEDPAAYLQELEARDQALWMTELETMDPAQHTLVVARLAEERAQEQQQKREEARIEAAEKRARECSDKNATLAYIVSQDFVKRSLKAPSTAEFPWSTEISTRSVGDCMFEIAAFVDAQNGFGAMLRTRYSATMQLDPVSGGWRVIALDIAG